VRGEIEVGCLDSGEIEGTGIQGREIRDSVTRLSKRPSLRVKCTQYKVLYEAEAC